MKKKLNKNILAVGMFVVMVLLTITPPSHAQVVTPDEAKAIAMDAKNGNVVRIIEDQGGS